MSGGHNRIPHGIQGAAGFYPPAAPDFPPFNPKHIVVEFLNTRLEQESGRELTDGDVLGNFPPKSQAVLEKWLGHSVLRELVALSEEKDPELFWQGALRLAQRLEREERIPAAIALYQEISHGMAASFVALHQRAERDLHVLQGQGEFGDRFEFLLRRASHEVTDPWAVAAFGTGSMAFRAARLGVLSRLWSSPAREFLPSRTAANMVASLAGIGAEAPAILLTSKLGHEIDGHGQDWRAETLAHEVAGIGLTLATLRGFGALGERAVRTADLGRTWQKATPQATMFGGILLAQRSQELLGLKSETHRSAFLADGIATYLHFNVGGRLAERALGSGFHRWQQRLDWQAQSLGDRSGGVWGGFSPALATVTAGPGARIGRESPSLAEIVNRPLMAENHGNGGGSGGGKGPRLHLVRSEKGESTSQGADQPSPTPKPGPAGEGQQVLDLFAPRVLRSRRMDEKEKKFRDEVDAVMMSSASGIRRQALEDQVIAKLPAPRREELTRNLQGLHPEVVDAFATAARDMPWQVLAQTFIEMKLMRPSPGELKLPESFEMPSSYDREALTTELRLDHQRLFDNPLPGAPEILNTAVSRLSASSAQVLSHWIQSPGTRLLMGQRLGLPGFPAEAEILQAYQKWLDRPSNNP